MLTIGLTGSIGMGKSTAVKQLRRMRIPVFDADKAVHKLLSYKGKAVDDVLAFCPSSKSESGHYIDRVKLGKYVFFYQERLQQLERILHPLVWEERDQFLAKNYRYRSELVVLDIPLLFETGNDYICDKVIVISAPKYIQQQRVIRRNNFNKELFDKVESFQLPDLEKRKLADFVVYSGLTKGHSVRQLNSIITDLMKK